MKNTVQICAILTLVTGCGGGGGPSAPAQAPAIEAATVVVPLRSAIDSQATKGLSANFSLSGTSGGAAKIAINGSGALTAAPSNASSVNGVPAVTSTQDLSGSVVINGTSTPLANKVVSYFGASDISRIADESAATFIVYGGYSIPATAKAGDSGSAWTATIYKSRSQVVAPGSGRIEATYSVTKDTASSLLVTITSDTYGDDCDLVNATNVPSFCPANLPANHVFAAHTGQTKTVYRIGASGTLSLVSIHQDTYDTSGAVYQSMLFSF